MRRLRFPLLLALAGGSLLAGNPAYADNAAPRIVSIQRTTASPEAGKAVAIDVEATDGGTSTIQYVQLVYIGPRGHMFVPHAFFGQTGGRRTATALLNPWASTGRWRLDRIQIYDAASNWTLYDRDGTVETRPAGAEPAEPSTLDFEAADFDIVNPQQDLKAPSIESIDALFDQVVAGQPQAALYSMSDDRSGIKEISVQYYLPDGNVMFLSTPADLLTVGPVAGLVPLFTDAGRTRLAHVSVRDGAGNHTHYSPGRVTTWPSVEPADTVNVNPTELEFDVVPVAPDTDYPVLHKLTPRSTGPFRAGESVTLDFEVSDETTAVEYVRAGWRDQYGHYISGSFHCIGLRTGSVTMTIPSYIEPGTRWALSNVDVLDRARHGTVYDRDGFIHRSYGGVSQRTTEQHATNLSIADFEIEAGPPRQDRLPKPPVCDRSTTVDVVADPSQVRPGETADVEGSVRAGGAAVGTPVVALYEYDGTTPTLLGVVTGRDSGAFKRTIAPRSGRTYRARFLGSDGHNPAQPVMSAPIAVRVGDTQNPVRTTIGLGAPDAVDAGDSATIDATLRDAVSGTPIAGRSVVIEARRAGTTIFSRIATRTTDESGRVRVVVRPSSATEYRGVFAGTSDSSPATSAVRPVGVRPRIWMILDRATIPRGGTVTMTAGVGPSHAGHSVVLVRKVSSGWQRVAITRLDAKSRAVFRIRPPAGRTTYAIATVGHTDHRSALSTVATVSSR